MNIRRFPLMRPADDEGGGGGGGGGNPPAPAPAPTPAPPAPSPSPAPSPTPAPPAPTPAPPAPSPSPAPAPAKFPDNWRDLAAGTDEKARKLLDRYADPGALVTAYRNLQAKVSSGEIKLKLGENATPEELAEWREANGIPKDETGYVMPEGITVGEADKPLVDTMLKAMHGLNIEGKAATGMVGAYFKMREAEADAMAQADVANDDTCATTLREEWGADYRRNANAARAMLDSMPPEVSEAFSTFRDAKGVAALHNPAIFRWLAQTSRTLNPLATVVPPGENQAKAVSDEIASWEKKMGDRSSDYWKGPNAEKNQQRYRELVDARDRLAEKK